MWCCPADSAPGWSPTRFYTQDSTEEVYTEEGIAWVHNTTMSDILM